MRRRCRCSWFFFMVLILGVLVGGIAAWLGQGKWRRAARRLDGEVRALHDEIEQHPPPFRHAGEAGACAGACSAAAHPAADSLTGPAGSALRRGGEGC